MLYLIQSSDIDTGVKVLKIGYTDDIEKRKSQYKAHNILCKFLDTREGDEVLEKEFHLRFTDYKYPELDEWFYWHQDIIDHFHDTPEELDLWLWEKREKLYSEYQETKSEKIGKIIQRIYSTHSIDLVLDPLLSITELLKAELCPGQRYSSREIERCLGKIYAYLGLSETPRAIDIEKYLQVSRFRRVVSGKVERGYQILGEI